MCGIYGVIGKNQLSKSIDALKSLEYRGYDSSGIAFLDNDNNINVFKSVGKIEDLNKQIIDKNFYSANSIIAHTRWATHGGIKLHNAHPHYTDNVAIVHNGIITNYDSLREKLKSYEFYGDCDSEVIAKLIDYYMQKNTDPLIAFSKAIQELEGTFAILCIIKGVKNTLYIARKQSPIYVAKVNDLLIASSDLIALPKETKQYIKIDENEICELKNKSIKLYDFKLNIKKTYYEKFNINENKVSLGNFSHFMIKEINDIPKALQNTFNNFKNIDNQLNLLQFNNFKEVHFIACGTAYHSACIGAFLMQKIAKIPAKSHIASDWIDYPNIISNKHLYVFISQSGETFDTILALKKAKSMGATTLTITNTSYSTLSNLSDFCLPIVAGKEVAVASTKVYNACNLACIYLSYKFNNMPYNDIAINYNEIAKVLNNRFEQDFAKEIVKFKNVFFIGKCEDYILAKEASLKLKEITYINSSAYPSGELKHGTLALISEDSIVIAFLFNHRYKEKILNAISEIRARKGKVLLVTNQTINKNMVDYIYNLNEDDEISALLYSCIPMQKIAYYTALLLKRNPDKPRNLAKSVTVA